MYGADLAANLPRESATIRRILGPEREAWTLTNELLAAAVDRLSFLAWAKTKDAAKKSGGSPPRPIPRPSNNYNRRAQGKLAGALSLTVDEVKRRLALPRREVETD